MAAAAEEGAAALPLYSWARPQPSDGVAADVAARILAVLRDAGFGSRVRGLARILQCDIWGVPGGWLPGGG